MQKKIVVGIDSGSSSSAVVALDGEGCLVAQGYAFHHGRPADCVRGLLDGLLPEGGAGLVAGVAVSSSAPAIRIPGTGAVFTVDGRLAEIKAARRFHPEARSLLVVGAEKFARISFDGQGNYRRMRGNSACAAGTGAFLDQQAGRLGLKGGSAELAALALANSGERPAIASRCSVFAKTDLIHAQQEGWSLEEICDGLCEGLARNIADTLFPGECPEAPVFVAGGVSRNAAVMRHLSALAGSEVRGDVHSHLYEAIGAGLEFIDRGFLGRETEGFPVAEIELLPAPPREYANSELPPPSAGYPDFSSLSRKLFVARKNGPSNPVEVDLYLEPRGLGAAGAGGKGMIPVLLGLDIGSTSTKAAILSMDGRVVAGLYTRTAGRPLEATQSIFEAIADIEAGAGLPFEVRASATTGSGRKLVASVIGADSAIDEITAHARAAVEIDPEVDTIIEIGGQDSKFTLVRKGIVVFSQMNAVCAAGTGSFLEEQGARLGVPLADFAERAIGKRAPLTSDRCTVFMERDLNHFQSLGYSTDELLAASLYSVCDNYLGKVAQRGSIGERVTFQGATAKNRALVAVFESRLGRPIRVSKFCHLTGAMGAALQARDEKGDAAAASRFRGFGIHALDLESRAERCGLCNNNCRLRVIDVGGEEVAYGFLCGRDYSTKRFVGDGGGKRNRLNARRRAIEAAYSALPGAPSAAARKVSIGIPTSLYLADDAPFWKAFWERLGFDCVLAEDDAATLRTGKRISGAEFCAPMALLHGQVHGLLSKCDRVFLPVYLEERTERRDAKDARRYYCNYSEYAAVVTRCAEQVDRARLLCPLLLGRYGDDSRAMNELAAAVADACRTVGAPSRREIEAAYRACLEARRAARAAVRGIFAEAEASISGRGPAQAGRAGDAGRGRDEDGAPVGVVLIGRPYAIHSEALGKGIPDMIAKRGVEVLSADMLPELGDRSDIDPLLAAFHWRYAAEVLKAARFCAAHPSFYPVFVTSFKCSPDAFAIEWFKRILDGAGKPYLILQIDEHDSSVGYETRVEAGLRSFRNHARMASLKPEPGNARPRNAKAPIAALPVNPVLEASLRGKTVLVPNWDSLVSPLIAANLRGSGLDARAIDETPGSIRRAMGSNTGQCIPISIIARECAEYVKAHSLDPSSCVLWISEGMWPCNIPLYPHYMKSILEHLGGGMEAIGVYQGPILFLDVGVKAMIGTYHAFLAGGTLRRLVCRTRPYELEPGAADRLAERAMAILVDALENNKSKEDAYREAFLPFREMPLSERNRPKVAIFGDLYARDNDVLNQELIRSIEAAGGEAVTTSYLDYVKAVLDAELGHLAMDGKYGDWATLKGAAAVVSAVEKALSIRAGAALDPPHPWRNRSWAGKIASFGIRPEQEGECFDNAIKLFRMLEDNPDISLFVETSPAFCCPSIVTQAMGDEIERVTGVPVVCITYDGTGAPKNDVVVPFLALRS